MQAPQRLKASLAAALTKSASFSMAPTNMKLNRYRELVITLDITSAERDSGDETYDFYITTGDGSSSWDICHFPQIATTGVKQYVMRLFGDYPSKTVASNGAETVEASLLTSSTNATKTLAAGSLRHGPWANRLGYELVIAGTVATGVTYSIRIEGR
jgi:hypothetical protein